MAFRMGLLGKKIGMTQAFDDKGIWTAICAIETGPCVVLEVLSPERDGYSAIRLGFDEAKPRNVSKPRAGQFARANTSPKRFVREIRLTPEEAGKFELGQTVNVGEVFQAGDIIDVTGTSKGKGFQGVIKRHHYHGTRATHGTHEVFRHGGSIGCRLTPGRVWKGKPMPGQMGNKRVTVQNVKVVEVIEDRNLLLLSGGIPGSPMSYVMVHQGAKHAPRPFVARPAPQPAPEPAPQPEPESEPAPETA